jgi:septation ring formation regulator EzrA
MFGNKNYDKEIADLMRQHNEIVSALNKNMSSFNNLQDLFSSLQESMIQMAKVQAQHKAIITFLVNHATVDADAEEDLHKMMQDIMKVEKDVKLK